ncbi:hypothetical protein [Aliiroseovarius sp.]|uniref:hypothetical protein n=1 Tax=Aliiroseovarius sp. TaxID=1872442 RepID=UPI003BABABDD
MQRLILFILFALPWWAYLGASGGVVWLGYQAYQMEQEKLAERQAQAAAPMPEVVDLSDFDRSRDVAPADELHVKGWINTDYNYELIKRTNGVRTGSRFMFVLFGSEDDATSRMARAAIIFSEADKDRFVDEIFDYAVDYTDEGLVIGLNGFEGSGDGYSSMVYDAFRDEGLTRAPNFVFIEPFLDGRQVALTATGEPIRVLGYFLIAAAVFAMVALAKFAAKRRKKPAVPKQDPFAGGPIAGAAAPAPTQPASPSMAPSMPPPMAMAQPGSVMADSITDDTPLGRIKRRQQEQLAAEQAALMPPPAAAEPAPLLGEAPAAAAKKKSGLESALPKLLIVGVVLIALSQMVPGLAFLPMAVLPLAFVGGLWFLMYKVNRKLSKGIDALRGVEEQTDTVAKVAGMNITRTKKVRREGGSALNGLFKGKSGTKGGGTVKRDRTAATRAKLSSDPFDKLAAQVRSGQ